MQCFARDLEVGEEMLTWSGQYEPVVSVETRYRTTVVQLQDPSGVVYQTSLDSLDLVTTR